MNENANDLNIESRENKGKFIFVGNLLWLDFMNTQIISDGQAVDLLTNGADVTDWLMQAGVIAEAEANKFPTLELAALTEMRDFRAGLRNLAAALADGKAVAAETVAEINRWLARRNTRLILKQTETGYVKISHNLWETELDALSQIAESAADLLVNGDFALLRKCENPQCVLYFYDTTKNHARRWCSMSACGNRHKVAAHYQRKKAVSVS